MSDMTCREPVIQGLQVVAITEGNLWSFIACLQGIASKLCPAYMKSPNSRGSSLVSSGGFHSSYEVSRRGQEMCICCCEKCQQSTHFCTGMSEGLSVAQC